MFSGVVSETFYDKAEHIERRRGQAYRTNDRERLDRLVALGLVKLSESALPAPLVDAPPLADTGMAGELKKLPGGFYQLPDGQKVRGKAAADAVLRGHRES